MDDLLHRLLGSRVAGRPGRGGVRRSLPCHGSKRIGPDARIPPQRAPDDLPSLRRPPRPLGGGAYSLGRADERGRGEKADRIVLSAFFLSCCAVGPSAVLFHRTKLPARHRRPTGLHPDNVAPRGGRRNRQRHRRLSNPTRADLKRRISRALRTSRGRTRSGKHLPIQRGIRRPIPDRNDEMCTVSLGLSRSTPANRGTSDRLEESAPLRRTRGAEQNTSGQHDTGGFHPDQGFLRGVRSCVLIRRRHLG